MNVQQIELNYDFLRGQNRQTLLLLHGFMGSAADWLPVIEHCPAAFNYLTVDLPGHGNSPLPPALSVQSTAEALVALVNELDLNQVHVLGYSLGGRLALYLAVHYPQRFSSFIIESASPGISAAQERAARRQTDEQRAEQLEQQNFKDFLQEWYRQPLFADLNRHPAFKQLLKRRLKNDPHQLAQVLRGLSVGRQKPLWRQLASIRKPVLLISGEQDEKYKKICADMKQQNPAFRWEQIKQCGHNVHAQQARLYADVLGGSLNAHSESEAGK